MNRLVLEVGTEAIPAGYVPRALAAWEETVRRGLADLRLECGTVRVTGTACRLVLELDDLPERQEDRHLEVLGPRWDIAFRDGAPTPAAQGFARKNGVEVEALEQAETDKGTFVRARVFEEGRTARDMLPAFLKESVEALAWPKTMVWETGRFRFPRPVRWVLCLLDDAVLPLAVAGLPAGDTTRGHRLFGNGTHPVPDASALDDVLLEAGVVLDPDERRRRIESGLSKAAAGAGGELVPDPGLVAEVVFLAEHPNVLAGTFDGEFLELPREVIVTAMRSHQRYFAVESAGGELLPAFLVVADGRWDDPGEVVAGNERVLRARLADARFYWEVDHKLGLPAMADRLANVVWLEAVGTLAEKAARVEGQVDHWGRAWFADRWSELEAPARRAARLAKADLVSEMIKDGKEFTGLQGVIGARYAARAGESEVLVRALEEQYLPRGAGDPLPETPVGTVLAFADRADTLAGCWAAGFVPSGSEDPYALRRAANGMIRILLEKGIPQKLDEVVRTAVAPLPEAVRREGLESELLDFLRDRTAYFLREDGLSYDTVDAVLAADAAGPVDARARAQALAAIRDEADLERLVVGYKRAANLLKGLAADDIPQIEAVDWAGADPVETALREKLEAVSLVLAEGRKTSDYPGMLRELLGLRAGIDAFFDGVMVMSEDPGERARRLALLAHVRELFGGVFDPSRIVIEGES